MQLSSEPSPENIMGLLSPDSLALVGLLSVSSAPPVAAQKLRDLELGVPPHTSAPAPTSQPSALELTLLSLVGGVSGASTIGTVGFMIDGIYCKRHHGKEESFIFGPCTFYTGAASATGWFGGAIVGSTLKSVRIAERRGCQRRDAILRAAAGGALGVLPGATIVALRPSKYPASRSFFIAAAPIFSGLGAAAAVAGCHN
jgi:hypothetical protein